MTTRPKGSVFLKVDVPEELYARFVRACEALTGRPRQVSSTLRKMVEAVVQTYEAERDDFGDWPDQEGDRDTLAS